MKFIEKIRLIERADGLIRRGVTGPPKALAYRLGISERAVYDIMNLMKEMGAPIYFCNAKNSYRYEYEVELSIGFYQYLKKRMHNFYNPVNLIVTILKIG